MERYKVQAKASLHSAMFVALAATLAILASLMSDGIGRPLDIATVIVVPLIISCFSFFWFFFLLLFLMPVFYSTCSIISICVFSVVGALAAATTIILLVISAGGAMDQSPMVLPVAILSALIGMACTIISWICLYRSRYRPEN